MAAAVLGLISRRIGELLERPFIRIRGKKPSGNGFLTGLALGVLYVPCAGPVLATITVLGASGQIGLDPFYSPQPSPSAWASHCS
ncbi:hypothetical protein [Kibdelosporangium philippinense]|uniref:hypothetical protein n=1 Tax=Kibdelosporangium philippinense TaxID=211113 RepID=UPI00361ECCEA